jgi:hypothetical protein
VGTTPPRGPKGSPVGEGQGPFQRSLSEPTTWAKIKEISGSVTALAPENGVGQKVRLQPVYLNR